MSVEIKDYAAQKALTNLKDIGAILERRGDGDAADALQEVADTITSLALQIETGASSKRTTEETLALYAIERHNLEVFLNSAVSLLGEVDTGCDNPTRVHADSAGGDGLTDCGGCFGCRLKSWLANVALASLESAPVEGFPFDCDARVALITAEVVLEKDTNRYPPKIIEWLEFAVVLYKWAKGCSRENARLKEESGQLLESVENTTAWNRRLHARVDRAVKKYALEKSRKQTFRAEVASLKEVPLPEEVEQRIEAIKAHEPHHVPGGGLTKMASEIIALLRQQARTIAGLKFQWDQMRKTINTRNATIEALQSRLEQADELDRVMGMKYESADTSEDLIWQAWQGYQSTRTAGEGEDG